MIWISPSEVPDWLVRTYSDTDYWYALPSSDQPAVTVEHRSELVDISGENGETLLYLASKALARSLEPVRTMRAAGLTELASGARSHGVLPSLLGPDPGT